MKSMLIRVGALGGLFLLGWIAIAQAQRGGEWAAERTAASETAAVADDNANPLREPYSPPATVPETPPSTNAPRNDPFGLRNRPPVEPTANEEPTPAGPTLAPVVNTAPVEDRYAVPPPVNERVAARDHNRYEIPAAAAATPTEERSPAPFNPDPSALPANPAPLGNGNPNSAFESPLSPPGGFADRTPAVAEGTGQPGNPQLEGIQSPQLTIQKIAPKEIQVGKPASFRVVVRNVGQIAAGEVEIHDLVPRGARLLKTEPQARQGGGGELIWTLGSLQPGSETSVEMQIMPTTEGEIGSVATVRFAAVATARSRVTRPQLVLETAAPEKVLIGDQLTLSIVISNPGSGVATNVVLEERIPAGLRHPAGSELEYTVGDLKPGESRKLELPLTADRAGRIVNMLTARGDGNLRVENKRGLEVIAPQLDVAVAGPKRRYLERQATYQLSVANPGTAAAEQVELIASLPAGLKFVSANNAGYYEEATRTVHWRLEKLPAKEVGSVQLVTLPVEAGQHAIRLRGTAEKGLVAEKEQPVVVEGIAAILFQVADRVDPIGVGGETTYAVRVMNQGSKAATNVQLAILLPPELQPVSAEGPTRHAVDGNRIFFEGLAQLAPKAETTYRIRVKALRPGDLRVNIQLKTDDMQSPVTKQESTRVYAEE